MTGNNIFNKLKSKLVLLLALICFVTFSAFVFTACKDEEVVEEESTQTYTKEEHDEAELKNGSFEFGLADKQSSDYPISSPTDWGSAYTENSATSSLLASGIVNTDDDAWTELLNNFYNDSDFYSYVEKLAKDADNAIDKDAIKESIKSANTDKSDEEINELVKKHIVDTYIRPMFTNPKTHDGAEGSNVYMLNNYTNDSWYTAQVATSSTTLNVDKGAYGKISFYVYAKDLKANGDIFANVRINGTVGSLAVNPFILHGINGTDGWKEYNIYVKADEFDSTSFTVSLSLGYTKSNGRIDSTAFGTVYFDDVIYTPVSTEEFNVLFPSPITTTNFDITSESPAFVKADSSSNYFFNLAVKESKGYSSYANALNLSDFTIESGFTKSNTKGSDGIELSSNHVDRFGAESFGSATSDSNTISFNNLKYASYKATIKNNTKFVVAPEQYAFIYFEIENNLDRLGSKAVNVYVVDEEGKEQFVNTYSNIEEKQAVKITVKNNNPDNSKTFSLMVVVGPTDIKETTIKNDYATGEVILSNFAIATGKAYRYEKNADGTIKLVDNQKVETENYSYYSMVSSSATEVVIGKDTASQDNDTYYLGTAPSSAGNIVNGLTSINGYTGISYDHNYLNQESTNNKINERVNGDAKGNYAGLLNTKFLDNYDNKDAIKNALKYDGEKSIQPIMIYNAESDSYGFIGKSFTINQSAFAKISVKVRVTGDAIANVYLVDTSKTDKPVATFAFNKGNVEGDATYDKSFSQKLAFEGINKELMNDDGWLTLNFYVATGANAMNLRLELWNGSRDGAEKSQGFVFFAFDAFSEAETFTPSSLSNAFTEPSKMADAYSSSGNPLYNTAISDGAGTEFIDNAVKYTQELDSIEKQFNSEEGHSFTVSYEAKYVWASTLTSDVGMIYAIYNTVDPVVVDPYATEEAEKEAEEDVELDENGEPIVKEEDGGCSRETDPSGFWLSFSSIVLGAVLLLAIIMLIVKNYRRRRNNHNKSARAHYKVTSRYKVVEETKKKDKKAKEIDDYEDEEISKVENEEIAEPEEVVEETEQTVEEDYVYGDVQDFGEETTETVEENKNENSEN